MFYDSDEQSGQAEDSQFESFFVDSSDVHDKTADQTLEVPRLQPPKVQSFSNKKELSKPKIPDGLEDDLVNHKLHEIEKSIDKLKQETKEVVNHSTIVLHVSIEDKKHDFISSLEDDDFFEMLALYLAGDLTNYRRQCQVWWCRSDKVLKETQLTVDDLLNQFNLWQLAREMKYKYTFYRHMDVDTSSTGIYEEVIKKTKQLEEMLSAMGQDNHKDVYNEIDRLLNKLQNKENCCQNQSSL